MVARFLLCGCPPKDTSGKESERETSEEGAKYKKAGVPSIEHFTNRAVVAFLITSVNVAPFALCDD